MGGGDREGERARKVRNPKTCKTLSCKILKTIEQEWLMWICVIGMGLVKVLTGVKTPRIASGRV